MPRSVGVFVGLITLAALAVAGVVAPVGSSHEPIWAALPVLALLLLAATWFVVPFRYGDQVDAVNLIEAVLAPMLIGFPPIVVMAVVAVSQLANGMLRRLPFVKTLFNTSMWSLAAGLAGLVMARHGGAIWPDHVVILISGLAVLGIVNNVAFATVLSLAQGEPMRRLVTRFVPVVQLGWIGGWVVNAAVGMLFALAYLATPVSVAVFGVPLLVLHLAYRSYSTARADQVRLAHAHRAARALAEPLQPLAAVPDFLAQLAEAFDAGCAELVLRIEGGREIHRRTRDTGEYVVRTEDEDVASLEGVLAASPGPVTVNAQDDGPVASALRAARAKDCLAAPLLDGDRLMGAVLVLDRGGFEGSKAGELAIFEGLARETAGALAKGRLLADVLEERRKLAEIVDSASDGICTFAEDGTLLTWNPALEQITGLRAEEVVGRDDVGKRLRARTRDGKSVDLTKRPLEVLPRDLRITDMEGRSRHLTCAYSEGSMEAGGAALIVMARDVTPAEEHAALRAQFSELLELDAARRVVVERLQETVVPAPIEVAGAEVAAAYEASDPSAPTGGDLYDWQILPSGELHVAVVDVLGHGVAATKDALAVVHTLRVLTASGTPLEDIIGRADELLQAQHPDLVATAIVARYSPDTGRLRVAAGGHPPALVVTPRREVTQVAASGGVIGWPGAGSDNVSETVLEPGDALVLYTDGLVEARKNILDGMDALVRHAAEVADLPAAAFASELVTRALAGAERRDDTLALVLRRDPVNALDKEATWEAAPDAAEISRTRRALRDWLVQRGVDGHDAALAAGELLSNAMRSARARVVLRAALIDGRIVLDVSDDGAGQPGLDGQGHTLPHPDTESGRGLFIVRKLADHVDVLSTAEGSTIRVVLPVRARGSVRRSRAEVQDGGSLDARALSGGEWTWA